MDAALFAFPNAFRFSFDHTLSKGNQIVINATHPQHPLLYTLFVNQADYAFTRIDLTKGDSVVSSNGQYQLSYINNTQRFQKWNGKWYLSYKRHQWEVDKVNQETKEHIQKEQYFIELLVNEVNLAQDKSLPGDLGQLMDRRKPLEFQIRPYNENFWRTYNIIKQHPSDLFPSSALSNAGSNYMFSKSARQDSYELPVQMDEFSQWNFTREDTLLGSLNPMRNCYDVIFYRLNLDINPQTQTVKGSTEIHFIVTHATKRLQLDLNKQLGISAIWLNSQQLSFTRQFNSVFVDFPISLLPKSQISITVDFEGTPLQPIWTIPQYGAFVWAKDEQGNPWFQSICQGSGANGWWPNKDHLSDKADSLMLTVTTPASLKVIANGTLTKEQPLPNGKITYTWKASYPMLTYNVAINAGNYVPITATYNNGSTVLPLAFYVLEENRAAGERAFQLVKPMLDVYESYFGEYPFPKDGFKLVQTPFPMEHQSCVAVGKDLEEDIILHEAAHEWWGNSVSCVDFAELWIHEAFATYAVALFKEKNSSKQKAHAYFEYLKTQVSNKYPLIGKPGIKHIHYDITDMYSKGALMLHTLRNVIDNDSLWFSIIKGIQHDFKYKSITTEELINYFSLKTKADYTYVFNQYLRHTSIPELQISVQQKDGQSYMQYRWKTNEPNFRMPVKINTGGKSVLIHPTEQYQRIAIKTNQAKDIQVETGFYIKLSVLPK
jgi:aminopeptidase N